MRKSFFRGKAAGESKRDDYDDSDDYSASRSESYVESSDNEGSDIANWEEHVANDGSLFYAEYLDIEDETLIENDKRLSCRNNQQQNEQENSSNEFMFSTIDQNKDNRKIFELIVTATDRYRFGRRSTTVESILGFRVMPFPDQTNFLMVDGFVYDVPDFLQHDHQHQTVVHRGDWFKSLNNFEIDATNIDDLLLQFTEPTKVQLEFYGHKNQNWRDKYINRLSIIPKRIENNDSLADLFERTIASPDHALHIDIMAFALLILPPECYQNDQYKNSLFFYPKDPETNFLYKSRGSFLTLHSVLSEELRTKPTSSKLTYNNTQYYVCYRQMNDFLVLFAFPSSMVELTECNLRSDELILYMNLLMSDMNLQSFNEKDFCKLLINLCKTQHANILLKQENRSFTQIGWLKESCYLPLPKEGQLKMHDALSEMDAMDYRSWNEEPLTTHREYFICGSVLYYNHLMLISQMSPEMRQFVEVYLRCHGIYTFANNHRIKDIYIWLEIKIPNTEERHFLSICGRNHLLLAVILKLFEPDKKIVQKIVPSLFYIEEMQETLNHLIYCGIESLAMLWSTSNKRPEALLGFSNYDDYFVRNFSNSQKKLDNKQKTVGVSFNSTTSGLCSQTKSNISYDDETLLCSSLAGSSSYSLNPNDETSHKRRTPPNNSRSGDDSGSDSDWENFSQLYQGNVHDFQPQGQAAQVKRSLWKEIANIVPIKVSPGGGNSIYYFLYIDNTNNTVFCPNTVPFETLSYMSEIRRTFLLIHKILQHSKYSNRDNEKTTKPSAMPIKEYGTTIEINQNSKTIKEEHMSSKICLSMVGRLFLQPPREIYICHHPDTPYNMVELAFRLSFFPAG